MYIQGKLQSYIGLITGVTVCMFCPLTLFENSSPSTPLTYSSDNNRFPSVDPEFWKDYLDYEQYQIDYDYYAKYPFSNTRCVQIKYVWKYSNVFCQTPKSSFGLKENSRVKNIFGLSPSNPEVCVHGFSCIHPNATVSQGVYSNAKEARLQYNRVKNSAVQPVEEFGVSDFGVNECFSNMIGSLSESVAKWRQFLGIRSANPSNYYNVGMKMAMYYHHNQTCHKTICSRPNMKGNVICTYETPCNEK